MNPSSSEATMPRRRPPHLQHEQNRHGSLVWYVRIGKGPRVRLREAYDTPAFWAEYRAAIEGKPQQRSAGPETGTLAWALARYRASSTWAALSPATRRQRENIYRQVTETAGALPLSRITERAIIDGRERRAARPHGANNFVKSMRAFFAWASDPQAGDLVKADPTKGVRLLRTRNPEGYHTWTEEEVARFEERWPPGTRERLALDVLLYTGLRRGDAVRLGKQHIRDGVIQFPATEKTGEPITIPLLEPLRLSIDATNPAGLALIETSQGRPWRKASFGNWFRDAARAAGCPGAAHGLRKAGATRAAENGATTHQLMAIFGWRTIKQAETYTRAAATKRLAMEGAKAMLPRQSGNETARTLEFGAGRNVKNPNNIKGRRV